MQRLIFMLYNHSKITAFLMSVFTILLLLTIYFGELNFATLISIFCVGLAIFASANLAKIGDNKRAAFLTSGISFCAIMVALLLRVHIIYVATGVLPTIIAWQLMNVDFTMLRRKKEILKILFAALFTICYFWLFVRNFNFVIFGLLLMLPIIIILSRVVSAINFMHFDFKKFFVPKEIKKVSVIIPNYNYANFIEARIDSVVNQTYPIHELIILDDCSSDNSAEVIEKKIAQIRAEFPELKIKFIPNKQNSGNVFKQWAKCFKEATGDFVWIAEADDLCSKHFLNAVMRPFYKDGKIILSYAESRTMDENNKPLMNNLRKWIDLRNTGHWRKSYINSGENEVSEYMCTNNTIANVSGVVFKNTGDFSKYLEVSQNYRLAGDWYFYTKVLESGKIAYNADSLNYHRMHSGGVTLSTDNLTHYKEICAVQDSIKKAFRLPESSLKNIEARNEKWRRDFCLSDEEILYDKISLDSLLKKRKINDKVLLSVIVPVYNTAEYLSECLNSAVKNLPEKSEIIVINDGSTDNSEDIISEFAKNYKAIRYVKQKNSGLSATKNRGLKEARGKYVAFLDSDDYIVGQAYSTMLKLALDTNSDIVLCDIMLAHEAGKPAEYATVYGSDFDDPLLKLIDNNLMASSNNKLILKSLYDSIDFPVDKNNEDVAVAPILFLRSKKTTHIPASFYHYRQRSGSIQNSEFTEKRFNIFDTCKLCFDSIKNADQDTQDKIIGALVFHQLLALLIYVIVDIPDKKKRTQFIDLFCEKYIALDAKENAYLNAMLKKSGFSGIITRISKHKTGVDNISNYVYLARIASKYMWVLRAVLKNL